MADDSTPGNGPLLIDSPAALDRYLAAYPPNFARLAESDGTTLDAWLALGDDASESSYQVARRFGVPLVRLAGLAPSHEALAVLSPTLARQLRAVPLRIHNGMVAVAMEDPGAANAQATLDFLSPERIIALVASPHDIREAIARLYDQVEDRDVVRQLGLDPTVATIENEQEAQRLAREAPVVRIVQTLITEAVQRRASDHPPASRRARHRHPVPHRRRDGAGAAADARAASGRGQPHQGARRDEPGRAPPPAGRTHQPRDGRWPQDRHAHLGAAGGPR